MPRAPEPGAPEGGYGFPILETVPGPSNPWLSCSGSSGGASGSGGAKPLGASFGNILDPKVPINERLVTIGLGLEVAGLAMLLTAMAMMLAVLYGGAAAGWFTIAIAITVAGFITALIGGVTTISGIDPPAFDFRKALAMPKARTVSVTHDAPKELQDLIWNLMRVERLVSLETDLIDRARAAAQAGDAKWYEHHLRALYAAQGEKQYRLRQAGRSISGFVAANADMLARIRVEDPRPLRDALNPITNLREQLDELGITFSDVNAMLAKLRMPSPLLAALERAVASRVAEAGGTCAGLLKEIAAELEAIETVDWDAFGGKPRTGPG